MSHAGEFLDTPSALSLLINLAGKMRMLSHRIALIILAGKVQEAAAPGHGEADAHLEASLNEFRLIHAALSEGSPQLRIAPDVAALLRERGAIDQDSHAAIEDFIRRADLLSRGGNTGRVMDFVNFVSGRLLQRLNAITEGVNATLDHVHDVQRANARRNEATVNETLAAIEKVSFSVRLIALNAATEAVRAGEAGRGFAVIASEIRALSDRATELVSSVRTQMR
jgi:methyl-accepting chemotaxis protein